jgi:hypothetical protein
MEVINPYNKETEREKWQYVENAIRKLKETELGAALYSTLNEAKEKFTVFVISDMYSIVGAGVRDILGELAVKQDDKGKVTGGEIRLSESNISKQSELMNPFTKSSFSVLAHELFHAAEAIDMDKLWQKQNEMEKSMQYKMRPSEKRAFDFENKVLIQFYNLEINRQLDQMNSPFPRNSLNDPLFGGR